MAIRIIEGIVFASHRKTAVLFNDITGEAFGPVFYSASEAQAWIQLCQDTYGGMIQALNLHQWNSVLYDLRRRE
jgi:hypothetical protein